jgi:HTH-type transcriptional regulator, transcriptional repressor of NAD biosynthesis genes
VTTDMSAKLFRCGVVVGKFAPLHRGHQLVIDRALADCDEVLVISWTNPEIEGFPDDVRADWLQQLYPNVTALVISQQLIANLRHQYASVPDLPHDDESEVLHRQYVGWLCTHHLHRYPDGVFSSEEYGTGFAAELQLWIRDHHDPKHQVISVLVDADRSAIPTSGTDLRAYDARKLCTSPLLDPIVASHFVKRVVLLGGESSGKSTLTVAFAQLLNTIGVAEYGRECWDIRGGELSYDDLLHIARTQVNRENSAASEPQARSAGVVVCDTSPLTTLLYCLDMFGRAEPELYELANRRYDLVGLCAPDFVHVQDGTRRDASFRDQQHAWYVDELCSRNVPFVLVKGSLEARLETLSQHVAELLVVR